MYGYIRLLKTKNDTLDYAYYKSIYCSLCHSLECNFGQVPRFLLSYDLTFMALLADALSPYQDEEISMQAKKQNCFHKLGKSTAVFANRAYLDYAANVSLLLAEQKLLDDQLDKEHRARFLVSQVLFKQSFNKAKQNYPKLSQSISMAMQNFNSLEAELKQFPPTTNKLKAAKPAYAEIQITACLNDLSQLVKESLEASLAFSKVLSEVFRHIPLTATFVKRPGPTPISILTWPEQDKRFHNLSDCLALIGAYLGAWLYLIDALSDLADDITHDKFNILLVAMPQDIRSTLKAKLSSGFCYINGKFSKLGNLNKQPNWQKQAFNWRAYSSLKTHEQAIYNLIEAAYTAIKNLQQVLDVSMSLLPYQRSANLLARIIQLSLTYSLEHNKLKQGYLFNLLEPRG